MLDYKAKYELLCGVGAIALIFTGKSEGGSLEEGVITNQFGECFIM